MTWFQNADNQTAATQDHVEAVVFVYLAFPSGGLRVHTRNHRIVWGGSPLQEWLGVGQLGGVEVVREDTELRPNSIKLSLSGVDGDLVTAAMSEAYHGREAAIYLGLFDTSTGSLAGEPETVFRGVMDYMTVELGGNSGTIVVNCESELARWQNPRGLLYTHESQQLIYEGDKFFDMVPTIQTRVVDWSKKKTQVGLIGSAALRVAKR